MTIDESLCNHPLLGKVFSPLYAYFRVHIAFTDAIHVLLGLGLGLLLVYPAAGWLCIAAGAAGHAYAFVAGRRLIAL